MGMAYEKIQAESRGDSEKKPAPRWGPSPAKPDEETPSLLAAALGTATAAFQPTIRTARRPPLPTPPL